MFRKGLLIIPFLLLIVFVTVWGIRTSKNIGSRAAISSSNRIGVRGSDFVNLGTGQKIYLRGNNYIRYYTNPYGYNFEPGRYDRARHISALQEMRASGNNAIRVIFSAGGLTDSAGKINVQKTANFVDFLKLAEQYGIYVLPVTGFTPTSYLTNIQNNPDFEGVATRSFNKLILHPGYPEAKAAFLKNILLELKNQNAPFHVIMGWQIENEIYFEDKLKPFTLAKNVTSANGKTYNMALQSDQLKMVDENTAYFINKVRSAIREVDPQMLVTVSYASPAHNTINYRGIIRPGYPISNSSLDFMDIHIYPGWFDLDFEINTFQISNSGKPVILGEFGAYPIKFPTIAAGAEAVKNLQVITCQKYKLDGWFYYDYDTTEMEPGFRIYHTMEAGGVINKALAPKYRSDPCFQEQTIPEAICGPVINSNICMPKNLQTTLSIKNSTGISKILFATFNQEGGTNDLVNTYAALNGNLWQTKIDASKHLGGGKIQTNVWKIDSAGTQTWCTSIVAPICDSTITFTPTPGSTSTATAAPTKTPTAKPSNTATPVNTQFPTLTPTIRPTSSATPPGTGQVIIGDVNGDNIVNILDIGVIVDNYNSVPVSNPKADLNKDGNVNIIDIGIVIDHYK